MTTPAGRRFGGPADNPADELRATADQFDAAAARHREQATALKASAAEEEKLASAAVARAARYRVAADKVAR